MRATQNDKLSARTGGSKGDTTPSKPLGFFLGQSRLSDQPQAFPHTSTMFPVAQAQRFFAGWHAAQPPEPDSGADIARMRAFFNVWKSSVLALATSPPAETFNCQQFASFAAAFSPACQAYRRTGGNANAWRAAGVGKDEMRNRAVLRWHLDRFEDPRSCATRSSRFPGSNWPAFLTNTSNRKT